LRGLRDSWLDPFRGNEERVLDRDLRAGYERDIDALIGRLGPGTLAVSLKIASLPEKVRGYGHVKAANARAAGNERSVLMDEWRGLGAIRPETGEPAVPRSEGQTLPA
jgi:indolepyruvate ferredoxin oxidoreductase